MITLIRTKQPEIVSKTYRKVDGQIKKDVVASIYEGEAKTIDVADAQTMAKVLSWVTKQTNVAMCSSIWHGAKLQESFRLVTEKTLAELTGDRVGEVKGGVLDINGERVAARLKRGVELSDWVLLDADNPPGMPDDWAAMSIAERVALWEPLLPGISSCERIELRGSSARVMNGSGHHAKTHAWLRVSDPELIPLMKAYLSVEMVLKGLSFDSPRYSRQEQGKVIGSEARSVFDLAVFDAGRLVFCSEPLLIEMDGYTVDEAGVEIINEGGGVLDISHVKPPSSEKLRDYKQETGIALKLHSKSSGLTVDNTGQLTMQTEIISKGVVKPLAEWVADMQIGDKLRCEAPFRASESEAAVIFLNDDGLPVVHDVGNATNYRLEPVAPFSAVASQPAQSRNSVFDEWAYLQARHVFRHIEKGMELKTEAFNLSFLNDVPIMQAPNGRNFKPQAAKYAVETLQIPQAYDVMYFPKAAQMGGMFFKHDGITYLNSYLPNCVPVADPNWQSHNAWQVVEGHLKNILPNDYELLVKWMAHNVQKPGCKILWAPIIKGIPGDGKTTIYRILMHVMGEKNVREISTQELNSEFNAWAEGACVAVLEEIRIRGHNRHDAMNKLKPVVTNETVSVVRKGRDGRNVPNTINYMALTNHEDALALDADDRRWGVFFTRFANREQVTEELDSTYWSALHGAYQQHPEVIRGWLESIDLSDFDANAGPYTTDAKKFMIEQSRPDYEVVAMEVIEMGAFGVSDKVISTDCLSDAMGKWTIPPRKSSVFLESLGFVSTGFKVKWRGKTRRVYVHKTCLNLTADTPESRVAIRAHLDDTDQSPF